jgi:hypothetical protein
VNAKEKVLRVIRGWESWSLYPQPFLTGLQVTFLVDKEKNQIISKAIAVDDDLDGVPCMYLSIYRNLNSLVTNLYII